MKRLGKMPKAIRAWWNQPPRERIKILLPWISIAAGIALAIVSLLPNVTFRETVRVAGEIGPRASNATAFPYAGYNVAEVAFEERPSCAIRLYLLDPLQADAYNASSTLPNPSDSLHCDRTRAGFRGTIALVVVTNLFNGTENYTARVDLFFVSQPYVLLTFPALVLMLGGAIAVMLRKLDVGLVRLAQEYSDRIDHKKEKR